VGQGTLAFPYSCRHLGYIHKLLTIVVFSMGVYVAIYIAGFSAMVILTSPKLHAFTKVE